LNSQNYTSSRSDKFPSYSIEIKEDLSANLKALEYIELVRIMLETIKGIFGINDSNEYVDEDNGYVDIDPDGYPEEEVVSNNPYTNSPKEVESQRASATTPNYPQNRKPTAVKPGEKVSNKVIGMPGLTNGNSEVIVIEPHSFEEMPQVIQALRERKSVVLNLNVMNPEEAQRAVDFIAGGTYAMDGHQERVGESIFLFTPSCVKVSSLTGVIHDVTTEAANVHTRRPVGAPDPWGEKTAIAQ
jgi:cell division inhibitor SepF